MDNKEPRQSNYTHVVTKLHPGDEVLCGWACLSNLLKIFYDILWKENGLFCLTGARLMR